MTSPGFTHLIADFVGVPDAQLRDGALISGLLIAAAGAAGFTTSGPPILRLLPHGGLTGLLLIEGCHITAHTFPDRALLLLDVLAVATHNGQKALDVFARRLTAREIRSDVRARG
ncbi:MAG: S-adenosylmethionine decarboxylase [Gemmatimonadaceae bacterium]